jgi:tungstate transport system permease protein
VILQFVLQQIRLGFHLMHGDPDLHGEIQRTLRLAFWSTGIAMLLGAVPAYLIGVSKSRLARWGMVVANAGLGLPAVAVGIFLIFIMPGRTPWGGGPWTSSLAGLVYGQTVLALPIIVALGAGAIRGLPGGMLDQARAYGASGWRLAVFAFREAKVGVLSAVILALGSAIAEVGAVTIIGSNNNFLTTTVSSEILNDIAMIGVSAPGGLGLPGAVEHAIIVLALMLVLAAFLTVLQQWGAIERRWQASLKAPALPEASSAAGPGSPGSAGPAAVRPPSEGDQT